MTRHEPRVGMAHPCPVTDCPTGCSPGHVVCRSHWRGIPPDERHTLAGAFRARLTSPLDFHEAVALTARLADHYARRTAA